MSANESARMNKRPSLLAATALSFFGTGLLAPMLGPSLSPSATAAPGAVSAVPWTPREASLFHRVAVFGSDERVPLPQSLRSVGDKIGVLHDPRSHSVCTAFCVARDIVATAAHCLYRTSDVPPLRLNDLTLKLHGSHTTSRIAGAAEGAPEPNVVAGSMHLNVHPPIDATRDWALVRLAQPVCKGGSFKLSRKPVEEVMRLAEAGRVYNVAYHRDLPKWQPMFESGCAVKRNFEDAEWSTIRRDFTNPEQLLLHTCDTGGASSGSPLLIDGPNGPEVVGINVGTYVQSKVIMLNGEVLHRFKSDDVANTGVNSLAFAASLDALRGAEMLLSRHDVRVLQQRLALRGLYTGVQDGTFNAETRTAVEGFERASEMPVTGLATRPLLQTLQGTSQLVTGKIPGKAGEGATATPR
jgi:Putative peptidoglycan binding domain/Trypsin-like peptidase domain